MSLTTRIINALRRPANNTTPAPSRRPSLGRVIRPRPEDSLRDYPSANLTPSRLIAILRAADDGDPAAAMQLYEEMEEKDPHLFAVANTRRLALTGLDWSVEPDHRADNPHLARAVADDCRNILRRLDAFDDALRHLSLAAGRNLAVAELVWAQRDHNVTLDDVVPVDFTRIVFDDLDQPRILTTGAPTDGIAPPADKFILHAPRCTTGHAQRGGLLRVTALSYLGKNLALKDWMIFAEVFGMPIRIARYEPAATAEEKRELIDMIESLGANAAGIFSRAVDLQIVESNRSAASAPYESIIEFFNREISKAWLGQTLTTDVTGARGSLAATAVHELIRQDILAEDIRAEARTIRRDVLTPLTRFRFGPDAPVPVFVRKPRRVGTTADLAELLDVAVNDLGLSVSSNWAHDALNLPAPTPDDALLPGKPRTTRSRRINNGQKPTIKKCQTSVTRRTKPS